MVGSAPNSPSTLGMAPSPPGAGAGAGSSSAVLLQAPKNRTEASKAGRMGRRTKFSRRFQALPILQHGPVCTVNDACALTDVAALEVPRSNHHRAEYQHRYYDRDRKSTRLNSSHVAISYAVFCLKKK